MRGAAACCWRCAPGAQDLGVGHLAACGEVLSQPRVGAVARQVLDAHARAAAPAGRGGRHVASRPQSRKPQRPWSASECKIGRQVSPARAPRQNRGTRHSAFPLLSAFCVLRLPLHLAGSTAGASRRRFRAPRPRQPRASASARSPLTPAGAAAAAPPCAPRTRRWSRLPRARQQRAPAAAGAPLRAAPHAGSRSTSSFRCFCSAFSQQVRRTPSVACGMAPRRAHWPLCGCALALLPLPLAS